MRLRTTVRNQWVGTTGFHTILLLKMNMRGSELELWEKISRISLRVMLRRTTSVKLRLKSSTKRTLFVWGKTLSMLIQSETLGIWDTNTKVLPVIMLDWRRKMPTMLKDTLSWLFTTNPFNSLIKSSSTLFMVTSWRKVPDGTLCIWQPWSHTLEPRSSKNQERCVTRSESHSSWTLMEFGPYFPRVSLRTSLFSLNKERESNSVFPVP